MSDVWYQGKRRESQSLVPTSGADAQADYYYDSILKLGTKDASGRGKMWVMRADLCLGHVLSLCHEVFQKTIYDKDEEEEEEEGEEEEDHDDFDEEDVPLQA